MNIRNAGEHDAPGIAAVLHAVGDLRSLVSESAGTTAERVRRNLEAGAASNASTAFVAENTDGEITGYCAVHWVPFLFLPGGEAYVTELFVRPGDAGKGIGSRLLDTVVAEARRRGCSRLTLLNGRDSETYRRNFYAQRGWIERERMANFIFPLANMPKRLS
jgi:GNAT superfamily N-acetyltransferase